MLVLGDGNGENPNALLSSVEETVEHGLKDTGESDLVLSLEPGIELPMASGLSEGKFIFFDLGFKVNLNGDSSGGLIPTLLPTLSALVSVKASESMFMFLSHKCLFKSFTLDQP